MSLTPENQVELLKDIMQNHLEDCGGSVSECMQIERLVKSLIARGQVSQSLVPVLEEIYTYGQGGVNSTNLEEYIAGHQNLLADWIGQMDECR